LKGGKRGGKELGPTPARGGKGKRQKGIGERGGKKRYETFFTICGANKRKRGGGGRKGTMLSFVRDEKEKGGSPTGGRGGGGEGGKKDASSASS